MAIFITILMILTIVSVLFWAILKIRSRKSQPAKTDKPIAESDPDWTSRHTGRFHSDFEDRAPTNLGAAITRIVGYIAAGLTVVTLIFVGFNSYTVVSTKNIGVITEFGRPVGPIPNGFHFKGYWQEITELDGAIQTDNHLNQKDADNDGGFTCTTIRIGNSSTACVDNSVVWRIKQEKGDVLFQDYRTFNNVRDSLVTREKNAVLNDILGSYDPLKTNENGELSEADLQQFGEQVTKRLQEKVGDKIEVINVLIPIVHFDGETQNRINALQTEVGNTRIAEQKGKTNVAIAAANNTLSESVSNDPNVLVSKCLDNMSDMIERGQQLPAGFNCWPGGGSALVVPGTTSK